MQHQKRRVCVHLDGQRGRPTEVSPRPFTPRRGEREREACVEAITESVRGWVDRGSAVTHTVGGSRRVGLCNTGDRRWGRDRVFIAPCSVASHAGRHRIRHQHERDQMFSIYIYLYTKAMKTHTTKKKYKWLQCIRWDAHHVKQKELQYLGIQQLYISACITFTCVPHVDQGSRFQMSVRDSCPSPVWGLGHAVKKHVNNFRREHDVIYVHHTFHIAYRGPIYRQAYNSFLKSIYRKKQQQHFMCRHAFVQYWRLVLLLHYRGTPFLYLCITDNVGFILSSIFFFVHVLTMYVHVKALVLFDTMCYFFDF